MDPIFLLFISPEKFIECNPFDLFREIKVIETDYFVFLINHIAFQWNTLTFLALTWWNVERRFKACLKHHLIPIFSGSALLFLTILLLHVLHGMQNLFVLVILMWTDVKVFIFGSELSIYQGWKKETPD